MSSRRTSNLAAAPWDIRDVELRGPTIRNGSAVGGGPDLTVRGEALRLSQVTWAEPMSEVPSESRGGKGRRESRCARGARGGVHTPAAGWSGRSRTAERRLAPDAGGRHGHRGGEVRGAGRRGGRACLSYAPGDDDKNGIPMEDGESYDTDLSTVPFGTEFCSTPDNNCKGKVRISDA